ncbi:MAG: hemolysin family protein [Caldimicrobium sp.]|nr:hemolysin family protein [Caldimicrobium sp.]MCX7872817.1 hemolysin family protein [Caldimicrobium sp.]MDW8093604.1 hemolysin family protein [Caldimicrobium sp.]
MHSAFLSFIFFSSLEAFFAFSEIAFISVERALIERYAKKSPAMRLCLKFWEDPECLFTTTTLGLTFSIVGNGIFTSYYLIKSLGNLGILLSTFILPLLMLLLGQVIPKSFGKRFAYPLVLYLAPPLYIISYLFYPIYFVNRKLSLIVLKKEQLKEPYFHTKFREIFLTMISHEEEIDIKEKDLIKKILEFSKKKVSQVMIPLPNVKALPVSATVRDALIFSGQYNFTYIPIYEGDLSNIKYIVRIQDLLGYTLFDLEQPLLKFARIPLYIPEIVYAHEALNILQREIQEIAIVVDEYGLVTGLVTIEDLVEEVLGEFRDALDYYEPEYKKLGRNHYIVKGITEIEKLHALGIPIPPGDYETLNGFLYNLLKRIPKQGETFIYHNITFTVIKATPNKVEEVIIKIK